jgi:hypothetical protein
VVAGPAEEDAALPSGCVGDRDDAGFGGEMLRRVEAGALVAEFGEDLGGPAATCMRSWP